MTKETPLADRDYRRKEGVNVAKYIINHNTKEIHRTAYTTSNCKIALMRPEHREDTDSDWKVSQLLAGGYNGCYWCYRSQDTG